MTLATLEITNLRCLRNCSVEFDSRCNSFVGANGAGKTSILEAIHLLSCGRSFRTNRAENLIKPGETHLKVAGFVDTPARIRLAIEASSTAKRVSVGGETRPGFATSASLLPVLVIDPSLHLLIEDGPAQRRKFLDWGTFHVEPRFVDQWRRYQRALNNRNAALKSGHGAALVRSWDEELIEAGTAIEQFRIRYLELVAPKIDVIAQALLGFPVDCAYRSGHDSEASLRESLAKAWERDQRQRVTTAGPHRADLEIRIGRFRGKDWVSRGQQKLLASALILGQLRCLVDDSDKKVCLLLDDPAAELDVDNLKKLLQVIQTIPTQLFITGLGMNDSAQWFDGKMFHVKQGEVV